MYICISRRILDAYNIDNALNSRQRRMKEEDDGRNFLYS